MASLLTYALTSLSDVKESLGIPSSNTTKDNLIIRKINQATRAIENYCGRRFQATTYTDVEYAATNTDQLVLRQRPVITFTALGVRDSGLNQSDWDDVEAQTYFVHKAAGVIDLLFRTYGHWNRYKVSYTAGYQTIPEDLAEACATLAAYYVNNASGTQVGSAMKKEGQRELRYANNNNLLSFDNILAQLGIDGIVQSYSNNPIMTNR